MGKWHEINAQSDIDFLMDAYGRFHDACIKKLRYVSGLDIDEDLSMHFGGPADSRLTVMFKRQRKPVTLELLFEGLRAMHIMGWQRYYVNAIYGCTLALRNDLVKGLDDNLIIWSDDNSFDPEKPPDRKILEEPMTAYIIADKLKWRFREE